MKGMIGFSVSSADDRSTVSRRIKGAYYVQKQQIIRAFRWNNCGAKLTTGAEAHAAMLKFLETRKDAAELFVNLVEFESWN